MVNMIYYVGCPYFILSSLNDSIFIEQKCILLFFLISRDSTHVAEVIVLNKLRHNLNKTLF